MPASFALPPTLTLAVQGNVWAHAVEVQRDRLMVVIGPRHAGSSDKTQFLFESCFFLTALLNLRRTVTVLRDRTKSPEIGEALKAFRRVVSDADLKVARAALHYSEKFTVGIADEQKANPEADHAVSWAEEWNDDEKVNFTIRVGPSVAIRVKEASRAARQLAHVAFGSATGRDAAESAVGRVVSRVEKARR